MSWAKRKVRSNYWSDGHRFILYHCAERIARQFPFVELDDLVDEAYLRCLRYRKETQLVDIRHCMSVMFRYVLKFYLKKQVIYLEPLELEQLPKVAVAEFDNFQDLYQYCMNSISPDDRRVFELKYKEQKGQVEIGKAIGFTQGGVSKVLKRIEKELRKTG